MEYLRKGYSFLIDMLQTLLLAAALFLVVYVFLFRPFEVKGESMFPNFEDKQHVITNLIGLRFSKPRVGDVIVFKAPPDPDKDFIKRVVGVPGDTIMIQEGQVYRNGSLLNENVYLDPSVTTQGGAFLREGQEVKVLSDSYFVLGDNRPASSDSREWGFVPRKNVVGNSLLVYLPLSKFGFIKNPF